LAAVTVSLALAVGAVATLGGGDGKREPAAPAALDAAASAQAVELDRLIDVFSSRAVERNESIEYQELGALLLQRARQKNRLSDYRAAFDAYTAAVNLDPDGVDGLLGLGRAALGVHDFATAQETADRVAELAPDDLNVLVLAGDVGLAVGDDEAAGQAIAALAVVAGDDPAVLVRQAQLAAGQVDGGAERAEALALEAIEAARRLELEPESIAYYQTFSGRLAFDRGDYELAAQRLETALANSPADIGTLVELARVRSATGETEEAEVLLAQANALRGSDSAGADPAGADSAGG
jgi:tetratricopeptide (TPR) repeat protein